MTNLEQQRLDQQRTGTADWRLWGPYLSERGWGTVREDYSADGNAWGHFSHDQARSRVYRWSEDGLGGLCDEQQRLCFALALWNGRDPILKERAFGLTGNEGNRGEDVKEYYFYLDATPSHSWLRYLYKYPQAAYPYDRLVAENRSRSRSDPPFNLLDTGLFDEGPLLGRRSLLCQGVCDANPHTDRSPQSRGRTGEPSSFAELVVPQHLVLGRRRRATQTSAHCNPVERHLGGPSGSRRARYLSPLRSSAGRVALYRERKQRRAALGSP